MACANPGIREPATADGVQISERAPRYLNQQPKSGQCPHGGHGRQEWGATMRQSSHLAEGGERQANEQSKAMLASCLVDGEISSVSGDRGARRGAFGISIAFEILVLGFLVVTP